MIGTRTRHDRRQRADQAADWLLRLHAEPHNDALVVQWLDWCADDAENLREFERMSDTWNAFDAQELKALIAMADHAPRRRKPAKRQRRNWSGLGIAASLIAAVGLAALVTVGIPMTATGRITLEASQAQPGTDLLADGTRVELGAESRVTGRYSKRLREMEIEQGEAFFEVAKDPQRPFVVHAGEVRVRAVGTAFNVRKGRDRTVVTVTEGLVEVIFDPAADPAAGDRTTAGPGEQVVYENVADRLKVVEVDAETMAAWQRETRTLKFEDEPLAAVIAYLNRHGSRQIVIRDRDLAELTFTGTVYHDRGDDWLLALEKAFPLQVTPLGDGTVLLSPRTQVAGGGAES